MGQSRVVGVEGGEPGLTKERVGPPKQRLGWTCGARRTDARVRGHFRYRRWADGGNPRAKKHRRARARPRGGGGKPTQPGPGPGFLLRGHTTRRGFRPLKFSQPKRDGGSPEAGPRSRGQAEKQRRRLADTPRLWRAPRISPPLVLTKRDGHTNLPQLIPDRGNPKTGGKRKAC